MATLFGDPDKPVVAVSRRPNQLDIFVVGGDGNIWTAWWAPGLTEWGGPTLINTNNSRIPAGDPFVSAVSRSKDKLDIFTTDYLGNILTAAWPDPTQASPSGWSIWRQVAQGVTVSDGSYVTAVSRSTDLLDVFVVGLDGRVYTAAWVPDGQDWRGWWTIGTDHFPQGANVFPVSRSTDKIDIFAVDVNGSIVTSAWQPGFPQWTEWRPIPGITTTPGANVFPVSRSTDKLDIFVSKYFDDGVGNIAGQICTAAWEPSFGPEWGSWRDLTVPGNGYAVYATPGDLIGAVSRATDKLDIFVGGLGFYLDGIDEKIQPLGVQTTAWEPGFPDWTPWRSVAGGGTAYFVSPVTAVSRSTDLIDIFATDQDTTVKTAAWAPDGRDWQGWWPA